MKNGSEHASMVPLNYHTLNNMSLKIETYNFEFSELLDRLIFCMSYYETIEK